MSELGVFLGEAELGSVQRSGGRGTERIGFRHVEAWLIRPDRFAREPTGWRLGPAYDFLEYPPFD